MFKYILYFLFLPLLCFAQQDYIILQKGDTLFGKVKRGNLNRNYVTVKNAEIKEKIHLKKIKEWKNGHLPVIVIYKTSKKRAYWMELLLVVDGKKQLYRDIFNIESKRYYVTHKNNYTQITKQNLDSILLSELTKCNAFEKKYKQKIIHLSQIENVVNYYNSNCKTD